MTQDLILTMGLLGGELVLATRSGFKVKVPKNGHALMH